MSVNTFLFVKYIKNITKQTNINYKKWKWTISD